MAYFITDACISCGACEPECPVNCISAGDDKYIIDENICKWKSLLDRGSHQLHRVL